MSTAAAIEPHEGGHVAADVGGPTTTVVADIETALGLGGAGRRLSLNAFLLRSKLTPADLLNPSVEDHATYYSWDGANLAELADLDVLDAAQAGDIAVAILDRPSSPAPWQVFVRESFNLPGFGSSGRALGAVVYCAVAEPNGDLRWVAYTFGGASHSVRRHATEPRFGLIVALNRIVSEDEGEADAGRLRQANFRLRGPYTQQATHRAARDTPIDAFRMDRFVDVLTAVGGANASDPRTQVYGARALKTTETLGGAGALCELATSALADCRRQDYRRGFGFIDNMVPVEDAELNAALRVQLFDDVVDEADNVDVLLPDDLVGYEDERAIRFIALPHEQARRASNTVLAVHTVSMTVRDHGFDTELRFLDADRVLIATAPVLDCLAAELVRGDWHYVLYDGDFYAVDAGFLDRLRHAVDSLQVAATPLPSYDGTTEGAWNLAVATGEPNRFICLDGSLIRVHGETGFEPCDILVTDGTLIHAKRKSRSSSLSHLFTQAQRSCEMLNQVSDARDVLRDLIDKHAGTDAAKANALAAVDRYEDRAPGVEVVFALLGDWHSRTLHNLPLLARLSLVNAVSNIQRLGFVPTVALVPLEFRAEADFREHSPDE